MKRLKKFGAIICAIAMIVSSITYYPTSNVSAAKTATSLPKKVIGLVANSKSGSDTIENAIMFAWAGADDTANVDDMIQQLQQQSFIFTRTESKLQRLAMLQKAV